MKRVVLSFCLMFCVLLLATMWLPAQDFNNAGTYISYINKAEKELAVKYLSYMSASSHGKNRRKVDKRRTDLLNSIYEVRVKIFDMPSFNGDKSLRDSAVNYLKILYNVFNEDYAKLVNMEEIAEQSYDAMEAYLLIQEKADEKLKEANDAYAKQEKEFAKKYNVNLIESQTNLSRKLEDAQKVSSYYHQVFLIFFKSQNQETYLLEALNKKNINGIEQSKNALIKYAEEGLNKLKSMKGYNADKSLETAVRKTLEFFKDEAEKKIPLLSDFLIKEENFEQIKKAFDAKPASQRTKQDVDLFNKSVNDINKAVNVYNATNQQLNTNRNNVINLYNSAVQTFMDTHMPYAR